MRSGTAGYDVTTDTKQQEDDQQLQAAENQLAQLKMNAASKKEDIPSAHAQSSAVCAEPSVVHQLTIAPTDTPTPLFAGGLT
jgi:transcription initiation factor TFIID subunit TAF12